MALRGDSIESRLEELMQDERRTTFDNQLRAFRRDDKGLALDGSRVSRQARRHDGESPVDQMVALIEELSRRIEGLEMKDRALADEMRQRARNDQRSRKLVMATEVTCLTIFIACWALRWV